MKKILLGLFIASSIVYAGLIDAIAMKVNDDIVTLVDIDNKMQSLNIDKQNAVNLIVDNLLFNQEIEKYSIKVDDSDIEDYMSKIAQSKNMTLIEFRLALKRQSNLDIFIKNLKQKLLKEKLSNKVLSGKLRYPNEEDTKIFYENNKELFSVVSKIDVLKYSSKYQELLINILKNPMFFDNRIKRESEIVDLTSVNSSIRYVLNATQEGKFSKLIKVQDMFLIYFVKQREDSKLLPYDTVKNKIFEIIMKKRKEQLLKDYFAKVRLEANIEVLR